MERGRTIAVRELPPEHALTLIDNSEDVVRALLEQTVGCASTSTRGWLRC
jgi:hypothetical protein